MKTIINLLIALAIMNAVARAGSAAWDYFQLKDATQQLIVFGAGVSTDQITYLILDKAVELDVPLERENIDISRVDDRTIVYLSYTKPVEFFPRFVYPLDLSFTVEARALNPFKVE